MDLMQTPNANRLQIGIFGSVNTGKSTLFNALIKQNLSVVSDVEGTTTDANKKAIEIHGIGPCLFIDTAGFDDNQSEIGKLRIEKTLEVAKSVDVAIIVFENDDNLDFENYEKWIDYFNKKQVPIISVIGKTDIKEPSQDKLKRIKKVFELETILFNKNKSECIKLIENKLIQYKLSEKKFPITSDFINSQDTVLLVMPQDKEAPKGRLILPQVQVLRELIDRNCTVLCCNLLSLEKTLKELKNSPTVIITDSKVIKSVVLKVPKDSKLSTFSILFAKSKGDIKYFTESAKAISTLNDGDKILISELCSHVPIEEDIGRVKIPKLLEKKTGKKLNFEILSGVDFPNDLKKYALIIQCGGCVVNKRTIDERLKLAKSQNMPLTNYGVAIAYCTDTLDFIKF